MSMPFRRTLFKMQATAWKQKGFLRNGIFFCFCNHQYAPSNSDLNAASARPRWLS